MMQFKSTRAIFALIIISAFNFNAKNMADELVYTFKGNVASSAADSHSQIIGGEGFVAVITIDPAVGDVDPSPETGVYPDAVLAGRIFFVGGYVSLDLAGSDVIIENQSSHDSIRIFANEFTFFEARVQSADVLTSDALPAAGIQFASSPDPATQLFDAFVYSDSNGIISHTSLQTNDLCFESKTGIAFAQFAGNPWYDAISSWLPGLNSQPPAAMDTVILDRADSGGVEIWWDAITGNRTCLNLCHNRGAFTIDNRDGGNYTLSVNDSATVDEPAQLILGDGVDSVNMDIANFLIVNGTLSVNETTSVESGFATDINDGGFIVVSGIGASATTGNGAMFVGINTQGTLVVREGATSVDVGSPRIGAGDGGDGVVSVEDPGSAWDVQNSIEVGSITGSTGVLNVQDGGSVSADNDIRIGGQGAGSMTVLNGSTVEAGDELIIHPGSDSLMSGANVSLIRASLFRNMGLLEIDASIGADIDATVENLGIIRSLGNSNNFILADLIHDGTEVFTGTNAGIRMNGAASGAGPYTGAGTVTFRGPCNLGAGTGVGISAAVTFAGDVQFIASSVLNVDLGGTAAGQFDQLQVAGDVMIAGELAVHQLGTFIPAPDDTFPIITVGGTLTGTFSGLAENAVVGTIGGVELRITYEGGDGNDVELYVGAGTLYGDVNQDGLINLLDVQPFIDVLSSGQYQVEADVNMDNSVDLLDVAPFIQVLSGG